jgi:hypothetical protein
MLVSPAPCTPTITSHELTSRPTCATSSATSDSLTMASNPTSYAACTTAARFSSSRVRRREMISNRGLFVPRGVGASHGSASARRRNCVKSGVPSPSATSSRCARRPTTARGKQCVSPAAPALATSRTACRDSAQQPAVLDQPPRHHVGHHQLHVPSVLLRSSGVERDEHVGEVVEDVARCTRRSRTPPQGHVRCRAPRRDVGRRRGAHRDLRHPAHARLVAFPQVRPHLVPLAARRGSKFSNFIFFTFLKDY